MTYPPPVTRPPWLGPDPAEEPIVPQRTSADTIERRYARIVRYNISMLLIGAGLWPETKGRVKGILSGLIRTAQDARRSLGKP